MLSRMAEWLIHTVFLLKSHAPLEVIAHHSRFGLRELRARSRQADEKRKVLEEICYQELQLSQDWFTNNITTILTIRSQLRAKKKILEIGSFEGLSTLVLASLMPDSRIHCVDNWEGSAEHFSGVPSLESDFEVVERNFHQNTAPISERLTVHKKSSSLFFAEEQPRLEFDFVYVDGSHSADDVLVDSISAFQALKPGGVIIFDDYAWKPKGYYVSKRDHPSRAVNTFLKFQGPKQYQILSTGYQLILLKK